MGIKPGCLCGGQRGSHPLRDTPDEALWGRFYQGDWLSSKVLPFSDSFFPLFLKSRGKRKNGSTEFSGWERLSISIIAIPSSSLF